MPKKTLPRIADVAPGKAPLTLQVRWHHGGEHGTDVAWTDEIDMAADMLWRLGGGSSPERS